MSKNAYLKNIPSYTQQKIALFFAFMIETIQFLGRVAWPLIDFIFRLFLANKLLIAGILMAHNWDSSVLLATYEYPIPGLNPQTEAMLGIIAQLLGGVCLLFGFGTRIGALAVIVLALLTQTYYVTLDVNLFWIALSLGYVLRGAGPISLDHMFSHGLENSAIPFASSIAHFLNSTRSVFAAIYILSLRCWLGITLFLLSQQSTFHLTKGDFFSLWFPLQSAAAIFSGTNLFFCLLFTLGLFTRFAAIAGYILIFIAYSAVGQLVEPAYWCMLMAILFVSGADRLSLDHLIVNRLKRYYPQLSGKPAFTLDDLPHVVIVGAGFGGIACAKALRNTPVKISLIDKNNYHLFQPLLYQVATGGLSPGDIAIPIRSIFAEQFNAHVLFDEVHSIDKENGILNAGSLQLKFDYLVIATGATHSYFGKEVWQPYAPGLKQIEDAISVRSKIVETFELAELAETDEERSRLLNFIVVGGGPTGVELSGAIAELARYGMEKDYRHFDPSAAKIILIQSAPRILPTFSESTSANAQLSLEKIGVKILLNSKVEHIDEQGVIVNGERIFSKSVLWAAGVTASPAATWLKAEADQAGRVKVNDDLTVGSYQNIMVIGDTALSTGWKGKPVPGLAPAAKQAGKFVAKNITKKIFKKSTLPFFLYKHYGSLATIGRKSAVAEFNDLKIKGAPAWWFWGFIHVAFLVGARNRLNVMLNWVWSYFTFRASNLLITKSSLKKMADTNE